MTQTNELDPLCLRGAIALAVTNQGYLIPCCRCDDQRTMNDPEFQKLLSVSKISDYENIEQIMYTPEWSKFKSELEQHRGPAACQLVCQKNKAQEDKQVLTVIDTSVDIVKRQEFR
jgi:hypothetical protein